MELNQKTCWITGASSGIGKEISILLAKQGAKLILSGTNIQLLNEVKNECLKHTSHCDLIPFNLENPQEVELKANEVVNSFGPIYLLVNNGGISQRSISYETPIEIDRKIMEIDYFSHVALTKIVIKGMIEAREGFIAVTSSIAGKFGFHKRSAYCAAKHALQGFFETLRIEVKPFNISLTVVYPGFINTPISTRAINAEGKTYGIMDQGQNRGMSAQKCATKYLKAIVKRKPEVVIGGKELIMVYFKRFMPWLFFRLIPKIKPT